MKAIRTKSGKYMCRPVDHYEYRNGKRIPVQVCITRDTAKEALRDALIYEQTHDKKNYRTFKDALERYIEVKKDVLSPTTLRSYKSRQQNAYDSLNDLRLTQITSEVIQEWINTYSIKHKPKTVANAHGLIMAVMDMFRPEARFNVTLPKRYKAELYTPTDDDIKRILDHVKGTDLGKAVMLAAFGTLRRGEACALTYEDIKDNFIYVNKSMSYADGWVVKSPKTVTSVRTIKLPSKVIEALRERHTDSQEVVGMNPEAVRKAFKKVLRELNLPDFRFHDLRAYSVSARHAMGIPDVYTMSVGGYSSDSVMKSIYRRTMSDKEEAFADMANEHFSTIAT